MTAALTAERGARAAAWQAVDELIDPLCAARIELRNIPAGSAAYRKHAAFTAELQAKYTEARKAYLAAFPTEQAVDAS